MIVCACGHTFDWHYADLEGSCCDYNEMLYDEDGVYKGRGKFCDCKGWTQKEDHMKWNQQGDVIIEPLAFRGLKFPDGKQVKAQTRGFILAEGEVTGHAHALEDVEGVEVIEAPTRILVLRNGQEEEEEVRYFIRIKNKKGASLRHEEHGTQIIPPGDYIVRGVREYDHFKEEARRVID